jgi:hypothetical protein
MSETALQQSLKIDRDRLAVKRSADELIHLLREFIPEHCRRDAWNLIAETFDKHGIELTTRQMRKEYEAWKELHIEGAHLLMPDTIRQPT